MNVRLPKELIEAIGLEKLKQYGLDEDRLRWQKQLEVDLSDLSPKQVQLLIDLVEPYKDVRGAGVLMKDARQWLIALSGKDTTARTVEGFYSLLHLVLSKATGHRVYRKDDRRDVWQAYYVSQVRYTPPKKVDKWRTDPPYVTAELVWEEFGGRRTDHVNWYSHDCVRITPEEALMRKGLLCETPELREEYERRRALFHSWVDKLGMQFTATGVATDDVDGNKRRNSSWWWRSSSTIVLDKGGDPARVVVDLFKEGDEDERESKVHIDRSYWSKMKPTSDDDDEEEVEADDFDAIPEPEVPLHPMLACFDMRRHMRLRIDVGQMTPYAYDKKLGDKLVLPKDERTLVEMLLAHRGGFNDIISGKSGGSIILCAGVPGTGKTLTAEVYAEVMGRALYSVQASQLGTDADELETELLKVFARASRWDAILLLDEADVYVAKRGSDLEQNAIVGVFLRVLEYYRGVLFLTTNRADLVDDAIASRCIARIDYRAPHASDQKRIWRILATTAGIDISDRVISQVADEFPHLTGRDVKNLLKLARLVSESQKVAITADVIRFVKRFKPTNDTGIGDDPTVRAVPVDETGTSTVCVRFKCTEPAEAGSNLCGHHHREWLRDQGARKA